MEYDRIILTPTQCKMARAGLDFGVRDLAALAGISPNTVARLERGETLRDDTLRKIRETLQAEGAIFMSTVSDDVLGVGVMCVEALGAVRHDPVLRMPGHHPSHSTDPDLASIEDVPTDRA